MNDCLLVASLLQFGPCVKAAAGGFFFLLNISDIFNIWTKYSCDVHVFYSTIQSQLENLSVLNVAFSTFHNSPCCHSE